MSTPAPVTVNTNQPPTANLTSPNSGQTFIAPASITVTANATAPNGNVAKVDFFQGTTNIGTSTTSPYTITWANVVAGAYQLTAKVTDNFGITTTSSVVAISVNPNQPPTISITSPANNASFEAPANITLNATATAPNGNVAKVDFFQGTTNIGTVTASPYTVTWNNVTAGTYALTAKVTDNFGINTTSNPITVTVNAVNQNLYFIYTDQLNTPRVITDQNNNQVWRWDNTDPFGANAPNQDPMGTGTQFTFNPRFPGQYFDGETGMNYNAARDYDPSTGRYIESDPIGLDGGINSFLYSNASPLGYADPDGREPGPPPPKDIPGGPWRWQADPSNSRGGSWVDPTNQSASWDTNVDHWDVDNGKGARQRYNRWGKPITPTQAHGYKGPRQWPLWPRALTCPPLVDDIARMVARFQCQGGDLAACEVYKLLGGQVTIITIDGGI